MGCPKTLLLPVIKAFVMVIGFFLYLGTGVLAQAQLCSKN